MNSARTQPKPGTRPTGPSHGRPGASGDAVLSAEPGPFKPSAAIRWTSELADTAETQPTGEVRIKPMKGVWDDDELRRTGLLQVPDDEKPVTAALVVGPLRFGRLQPQTVGGVSAVRLELDPDVLPAV